MCRDVTKKELFTSVSLVLIITFGGGDEKSTQADSHSRNFQVHDGGAEMMGGKMFPLFWTLTLNTNTLDAPTHMQMGTSVWTCARAFHGKQESHGVPKVCRKATFISVLTLCWKLTELNDCLGLVCPVQAATGLITTHLMGCYWIDEHRIKAQVMLHKESRKA